MIPKILRAIGRWLYPERGKASCKWCDNAPALVGDYCSDECQNEHMMDMLPSCGRPDCYEKVTEDRPDEFCSEECSTHESQQCGDCGGQGAACRCDRDFEMLYR